MTLALHDRDVLQLQALCDEHGGPGVVAASAQVSEANLKQILRGIRLPSGRPRGIGRRLREKLDSAFPGWYTRTIAPNQPARGQPVLSVRESTATYSPHLTWEAVVKYPKLPATFCVTMPDDSMAPRVRRGDLLEFDTRETPRSGDGVLVCDLNDNLYCRVYRQGRPGAWEAHPLNAAYLPLSSATNGLKVIAVLVGVPRSRWA